jgi:putative membrane protein
MRVDDGLRRDIVEAVQAIEKGSSAEVVVTVVPRSAGHWDITLAAALAAVFVVQGVAAAVFHDTAASHVAIDSAVVAVAVAALVRGLPAVERLLLPRRLAARRVEAAAESAFCRQGIFRTRGHTGVLVYLSLLEARTVLLPDDALVRALPAEALEALRAEAAALLAGPDPRAALLALLDHLRRLGARHLPPGPDDVNELADAAVTG